jgi:hypothetical protein
MCDYMLYTGHLTAGERGATLPQQQLKNKIRGEYKRTTQYRYTVQRCCLLLLRLTTTNSGCCIYRIFSISLLFRYQELRNGKKIEVCIFLLSIYYVSNYWVSSFTFYHLVKTREICWVPSSKLSCSSSQIWRAGCNIFARTSLSCYRQ